MKFTFPIIFYNVYLLPSNSVINKLYILSMHNIIDSIKTHFAAFFMVLFTAFNFQIGIHAVSVDTFCMLLYGTVSHEIV